MKIQRGFMIKKIIIAMITLGILAIIAIPMCVDLRNNANQAAHDGVAAGMESASAINKSACKELNQIPTAGRSIRVSSCRDISPQVRPALTLVAAGSAVEGAYNLWINSLVPTNDSEAACLLQHRINGTTYTSNYIIIGACN